MCVICDSVECNVLFQDVLEGRYRGTVQRECRHAYPVYCSKKHTVWLVTCYCVDMWQDEFGIIEFETEGKTELLPFSSSDLESFNMLLWAGDSVEFSIGVEKKSRIRGATNIQLLSHKSLPTESGIINALKNGYGFIRSADREEDLYFHFAEFKDEKDIETGLEVQYSAVQSSWSQKLIATNLKILPKGSVVFQVIVCIKR